MHIACSLRAGVLNGIDQIGDVGHKYEHEGIWEKSEVGPFGDVGQWSELYVPGSQDI